MPPFSLFVIDGAFTLQVQSYQTFQLKVALKLIKRAKQGNSSAIRYHLKTLQLLFDMGVEKSVLNVGICNITTSLLFSRGFYIIEALVGKLLSTMLFPPFFLKKRCEMVWLQYEQFWAQYSLKGISSPLKKSIGFLNHTVIPHICFGCNISNFEHNIHPGKFQKIFQGLVLNPLDAGTFLKKSVGLLEHTSIIHFLLYTNLLNKSGYTSL